MGETNFTIDASHATGDVHGGAGDDSVGGLVGASNDAITASYATGDVNGGAGADSVGSLVGEVYADITASHATGDAHGGAGADQVGGLAGNNFRNGTIVSSYATGDVHGEALADDVGGLVGRHWGGITASYATGSADGGSGDLDRVGGLVGGQIAASTITASHASGTVNGGDGDSDSVGGLIGGQAGGGTVTASYATGAVDTGGETQERAGRLIGRSSSSVRFSYGFGTSEGHTRIGFDGTHKQPSANTATRAAALTAGTVGANTNVGDAWNDSNLGTLNAWDLGDGNQPPALFYNDYDGTGSDNDIDYCALFAAVNIECGTLIPGQRTATTPQFGTHTGDIRLALGDTPDGVTANTLLPATLTVGGTTQGLIWSVHHDPETVTASQVTIDSGTIPPRLRVEDEHRTSTRTVILRATTGMGDDETIVNDYPLHIIAGSGALQNPALRFSATEDTLTPGGSHDFAATRASSGAITYEITNVDGTDATHATLSRLNRDRHQCR